MKRAVSLAIVAVCLGVWATHSSAQNAASPKIDYQRDVQPILRQNCAGCHGPSQQVAGFRADRRSSAFAARRIVPGGVENSLLYHRLIGDGMYGNQMPPTGRISQAQIDTIKTWIQEGAVWPDALANEADLPPLDPKAIAVVEALRAGDRGPLMSADAALLNARGPEGSSPFMYAVLYADAPTLEALIAKGANPKAHNDANATALIWAATDLAKTRVLLDHGADVNVMSDDARTALMIAATTEGHAPIVKLLLDHGANPNPTPAPGGMSSPLIQAATVGDAASMQMLIAAGADVKASATQAVSMAITTRCKACLDMLLAKDIDKNALTGSLLEVSALIDAPTAKLLLDRGADVNAKDPFGRTPLMYAAVSDMLPLDVVNLFISRGADVNAVDGHNDGVDGGWTVLDIANRHGDTPVSQALVKAGAKATAPAMPKLTPVRSNTVSAAVARSIPGIQRADVNFIGKAGCFSCHNDSLAAMAVSQARSIGVRVDEQMAAQQVKANLTVFTALRDRLHEGIFGQVEDVFGPFVTSYAAIGLDAEHHKSDLDTDAIAMYLRMHQMTDGHWEFGLTDQRPPICSQYVGQTALAMRALQVYAPHVDKTAYDDAVKRASAWLAQAKAPTTIDVAWRVLGLAWAGTEASALKTATQELLKAQKPDGGWSDIPSMESTAFATGQSLVALKTAGVPATDAAFKRGVEYLLKSQNEDGSWFVQSRAMAFQPYFDAGFSHGHNQWISAAGTSWATMALAMAQ